MELSDDQVKDCLKRISMGKKGKSEQVCYWPLDGSTTIDGPISFVRRELKHMKMRIKQPFYKTRDREKKPKFRYEGLFIKDYFIRYKLYDDPVSSSFCSVITKQKIKNNVAFRNNRFVLRCVFILFFFVSILVVLTPSHKRQNNKIILE